MESLFYFIGHGILFALFHHARQYIGNYGECCHAVNVQIVSARLGLIKDCVESFGKRAAELVGDNRIVYGGNNSSVWDCS